MLIVRFGDDIIVGFEHRLDAEQFLDDLRDRLAKVALELHADKTRLLESSGGSPHGTGKLVDSVGLRPSTSSASRTAV